MKTGHSGLYLTNQHSSADGRDLPGHPLLVSIRIHSRSHSHPSFNLSISTLSRCHWIPPFPVTPRRPCHGRGPCEARTLSRCHCFPPFSVPPRSPRSRRGPCEARTLSRCHWIPPFPVTPRSPGTAGSPSFANNRSDSRYLLLLLYTNV